MRIDVFSIFPQAVEGFCEVGLIAKARENDLFELRVHDLRSFADDPRRAVDDSPFGGGAGMVLSPSPIFDCVESVKPPRPLLLLSPGGRKLDQGFAGELSQKDGFSLLCGRYEGVDQRVVDHLIDGELSVGDYVLFGGEVGALVTIEAVVRLIPGVLGNVVSTDDESFSDGLLEYPQYTRPADFRGWRVPDILLNGNHKEISKWRKAQALWRTIFCRPDLLEARGGLNEEETKLLAEYGYCR